MSGTLLPLVEKNCRIVLAEALPAMTARKVTHDQALLFCLMYRRIGIARLFLSGLPAPLFEHLSMGARAYSYYLEGAREADKATSKALPFFDAIACNHATAAKDIADRSRPDWNEDEEYEEDFIYMRFLMEMFVLGQPANPLEARLQRYEDVLDGESDSRLDLCRAFLAVDQSQLDDALEMVISDRREAIEQRLASERVVPDDVGTTAKLSVEMLALLRFAETLGLQVGDHYPLAPDVARDVSRATLPAADAWMRR